MVLSLAWRSSLCNGSNSLTSQNLFSASSSPGVRAKLQRLILLLAFCSSPPTTHPKLSVYRGCSLRKVFWNHSLGSLDPIFDLVKRYRPSCSYMSRSWKITYTGLTFYNYWEFHNFSNLGDSSYYLLNMLHFSCKRFTSSSPWQNLVPNRNPIIACKSSYKLMTQLLVLTEIGTLE